MSGLAAETLINERACDRFRVFLAHAARAGCLVPSRPYLLGHGTMAFASSSPSRICWLKRQDAASGQEAGGMKQERSAVDHAAG